MPVTVKITGGPETARALALLGRRSAKLRYYARRYVLERAPSLMLPGLTRRGIPVPWGARLSWRRGVATANAAGN